MSQYIHFTEQQKDQARQTDLVELLRSQGERLKPSGHEYEWRDGSAKVTIRGNLWFHQYEEVGGDAIDFVRRFYNKNYPEAMQYLLGGCNGKLVASPPIERTPTKPFELPPKNDNMRRVRYSLAIDTNSKVNIATTDNQNEFDFSEWKDLVSISGMSYIILGFPIVTAIPSMLQ